MEKVNLSEEQVQEICESIPINRSIPEYVAKSIINRIRSRLYNDLLTIKIYPSLFKRFKEDIIKYYYKTLAESGLACGIQASTSLGERQTQTTLNTFHSAGLSVKTVVVGVPRFSELLNATKSPKMVNTLVYLNDSFNDISEIRERVGNMITDITFKRLIKSYELIKDDPLENWHHFFCQVFDINPSILGWRLRFYIDLSVMYEYKVDMKTIASSIKKEYSDAFVLYTPDWKGILDVFVDESCFKDIEEKTTFYNDNNNDKKNGEEEEEENEDEVDLEDEEENDDEDEDEDDDEDDKDNKKLKNEKKIEISLSIDDITDIMKEGKEDIIPDDIYRVIHMEDKILPALQNIRICGIENIKDIFFEKRKDEWIITTEGSNLYGLFSNPLIDKTKTMCNDMWEIYNIFGIEAARQFLVEEYMDVVSSDGSFVNSSNVELLVDIMVYTGTIISISRYGQKKVGCGPMAKASFEESLENFLKAGVNGEKESTDGVSASIMLGKMPKTGTGVFDLMLNIPKILNHKLNIKDVKDIKDVIEKKEVIDKKDIIEKKEIKIVKEVTEKNMMSPITSSFLVKDNVKDDKKEKKISKFSKSNSFFNK